MNFHDDQYSVASRVSLISILIGAALIVLKLTAGIVSGSLSVVSDAVHSLADIFSTLVIMISFSLTEFPGREKKNAFIRTAASIGFALCLVIGAVVLAILAIRPMASGEYMLSDAPGSFALIAAAVSIVCKEGLYWYTMHAAADTGLSELKADAWHHRSDAISSIMVLAALIGANTGLVVLDYVATLGMCLFILKDAVELLLPFFLREKEPEKPEAK